MVGKYVNQEISSERWCSCPCCKSTNCPARSTDSSGQSATWPLPQGRRKRRRNWTWCHTAVTAQHRGTRASATAGCCGLQNRMRPLCPTGLCWDVCLESHAGSQHPCGASATTAAAPPRVQAESGLHLGFGEEI